jgi:predicted O-methyltransferase YrrM
MRVTLGERGVRAAGASRPVSSMELGSDELRSHATPNHRGEVASRQASPRRSMSTNTLRMVRRGYSLVTGPRLPFACVSLDTRRVTRDARRAQTRGVSHPPQLPEIVNRAFDVSRRAGYVSFCRNETGRLLAMLAATRDGTMAEFGTGCGVGTAWLRSGVRGEKARIVTAELDAKLARAAGEIFEDDPLVEVLAADWSTLLDKGPYSLLFLDSGQPTEVGVDAVADLVEGGGIVVLDDFTPCEVWPPVTYGRVDTLREEWLTDDRFTTVEVMVASDASTLIATRR